MPRVEEFCPAKVNLFLEVLGRRPDGYHDLATVMVPVTLGDTLEVRPARRERLLVDPPDAAPATRDNTVLRALKALRRERRVPPLEVRLVKRIPSGAGLGGGSSDAAGLLRAVDRLLDLGLGPATMRRILARVGSDAPFFVEGRAALCTGRGELVHPLARAPHLRLVLAHPGVPNPTPEIYRRLRSSLTKRTVSVMDFLNTLVSADVRRIGGALFNRLEGPAFGFRRELRALRRRLSKLGPAGVSMTGSGSCLFALCRDRAEQARVAAGAREACGTVFQVETGPS